MRREQIGCFIWAGVRGPVFSRSVRCASDLLFGVVQERRFRGSVFCPTESPISCAVRLGAKRISARRLAFARIQCRTPTCCTSGSWLQIEMFHDESSGCAVRIAWGGLRRTMNDQSTSSVSPKQWVVSATAMPKQPMALSCGGRPLTPGVIGAPDNLSPVEYLLVSIAGCFALSCCGALRHRKGPPTPVEVTVTGEKALDAPSRVARIVLTVVFGGGMSQEEAAVIAQEAKHLCTVTNTILGKPNIEVTAAARR